jgi:hypothetical protein
MVFLNRLRGKNGIGRMLSEMGLAVMFLFVLIVACIIVEDEDNRRFK